MPSKDVQRKQWFFLNFVSIWLIIATIISAVAICITQNPLSLSLFGKITPPAYILYRITKSIFPLSENETRVAIEKQHTKKSVP